MDEKSKKVLDFLQAQCARREYCSSDIRRKALDRLEGDAEAADALVESLVRDGYVDDARYAAAFAREKAAVTGWGPVKIRFALAAKRIAKAQIDAGLAEVEQDRADARLDRLLESRWKALEGDPQAKLKLLRYALTRGYDYDAIRDRVERLARARNTQD